MKYVARLGGEFTVCRCDVPIGAPPGEILGVLLLALLAEMPEWLDRTVLARKLYPDSDEDAARAALRVALCRLRSWLGKDAIDSNYGRVRLTDEWVVQRTLRSGELANSYKIAPGLCHPLVDTIRRQWSEPEACDTSTVVESFIRAVSAATSHDKDLGRSILVSGVSLIESMHPAAVKALMMATRPQRNEDPYAAEFLELDAIQAHRQGSM